MLTREDTLDAALRYIWGQYRVWAATARAEKARLISWRWYVLIFSVVGAVLGTLCQQATGWGLKESWSSLPGVLGLLSAIALGLAAYFTREILSPERESRWIRSRSAAEALKAEAYSLMAQSPPYDTFDADIAFEKAERIEKSVEDIQTEQLDATQRELGLISGPITVEEYIKIRVQDQIQNFYVPSSRKNAEVLRRGRSISLILGVLAVVLGVSGAFAATAGWVAVVSTITAAIAAYLYAGRYQYLIVSYQTTARRLENLVARWRASGKTDADTAERNQFIIKCEDAISIENSAWMAEWFKKPDGQEA